jgi:CRISPR system Cascade subunit CasA
VNASGDKTSFNVLWDPWIPLEAEGNRVVLTSYRDLLVGVTDASDIVHPRDDMKVSIRVLLAALTQTTFPTRAIGELRARVREPLTAEQVDLTLHARRGEFELLGPGPRFLQAAMEPAGAVSDETERLFPDLHPLFKESIKPRGLCLPCMTVALYSIQAFAPAGGRGYPQCIRGSSSVTNLVLDDSVRRDTWNATLCQDWVAKHLQAQWSNGKTQLPWMLEAGTAWSAHQVRLEDVFFWMPRVLWIEPIDSPTGDSQCSLCARRIQSAVRVCHFAAGSRVTDGFVRHPHAPTRFNPKLKEWQHQRLNSGRPAWTGLAEMLMHGQQEGFEAAPVVQQWRAWNPDAPVHLLCHAVPFDKIKVLRRFSEQFTLSMDRWREREPELLLDIQGIVQQAAEVEKLLLKALSRGRSGDPKFRAESFWRDEASAELWRRSEPEFWVAVHGLEADPDAYESVIPPWESTLRRLALSLFDEHTHAAALDNSQMLPLARARRRLYRDLAKVLLTTSTKTEAVAP